MKRVLPYVLPGIIIFLLIVFCSCKTGTDKKSVLESHYQKAKIFLEEEKYSRLRKVSEQILLINKTEYVAAYYKALAMIKMDYQKGITFYLDYIRDYCTLMPDEYKRKWLDLVKNINYKTIDLDAESLKILNVALPNAQEKENENKVSTSKLVLLGSSLFYLNSKGELYKIELDTLQKKKINYYRTNDFIVSGQSVIFNDSINLLRYEYLNKKYNLVKSFDTVNINFIKYNSTNFNSVIQNVIDGFSSLYFYNIKKDQIVKLPEDCIDQSHNLQFFVRKNLDRYKIFDIAGEENFDIPDKYLGFYNNDSIFTYKKPYIYSYVLTTKELSLLFYYDNEEDIKSCFFKNDKLILVFKDSFILMNYDFTHLNYIEGSIIQMNKDGVLYRAFDDDKNLFYLKYDNDYEIYRINLDVKSLILSESVSSYLADVKDGLLQIYDLKKAGEIRN